MNKIRNISLQDVSIPLGYNANSGLICIGDSYCQGYTAEGDIAGWGERLKNSLGVSDANYFEQTSGGSGFTPANSYYVSFNTLTSTMTQAELNNIDNVVVGGGWGDKTATNFITDTCKTLYNAIRAACPNAKIHYFFAAFCNAHIYTDTPISAFATARRFVEASASMAGFHVIPGGSICLYGDNVFSSDGYHPNENGQQILNCFLTSGIFGNQVFYPTQRFNIISIGSAGTFPATYQAGLDYIEVTIPNYSANVSIDSLVCNGLTPINIGNVSESFPFTSIEYTNIPVTGIIRTTGTPRYVAVGGCLRLGNQKLDFLPLAINTGGTGFLTLNNVDNISFYGLPTIKFSPRY